MDQNIKLSDSTISKYLKYGTVAGIGIGYKYVNNKPTDALSVIVFVGEKLSKQEVPTQEMIPEEIEGLPTDVMQSGFIIEHDYKSKVRPLKPGYSCSHISTAPGAIGGFFLDKDDHPVILSCNHVIANTNSANLGDLVYQPGLNDTTVDPTFTGWNRSPNDLPYFATLKDFTPINFSNQPNTHDSAIAVINNAFTQSGMVDQIYPDVNLPLNGFGNATVGMQVQKFGRRTGFTTGTVIAVNASFNVSYSNNRTALFNNCIAFTYMGEAGDSGSMICDSSMNAVALLFAGGLNIIVGCDMNLIKDRYGLKLYNQRLPLQYHKTDALLISSRETRTLSYSTSCLLLDRVKLGDGTWSTSTTNGIIVNSRNRIDITAPANAHCFQFRRLTGLEFMQVTINTGNDIGTTYGPGVVLTWANGSTFKINLRTNSFCTSVVNGVERALTGFGRITAGTNYTIRIRRLNNSYVSELLFGGHWRALSTAPFTGSPTILSLGKTDARGKVGDSVRLGVIGTCHFKNLQI